MKTLIEIRAGEGGGDAKLLVPVQAGIIMNLAGRSHL